jgi:uncharacterized protein YjaG (DUF416 family)
MMDIAGFQAFLDGLEAELGKMPRPYQLAFGAACCERAFPNYVAFSNAQHWGDPKVLRRALDTVWQIIAGAEVKPDEIKDLEKRCHDVTPHSDDFGSVLDTSGQEASIAVQWLLRYCLESDPKCGLRVSRLQRDTIDCFVQAELDPDPTEPKLMDPRLNEKIEAHPLMRQELETQKKDLAYLGQGLDLTKFCQEAKKVDKSNIGLPLELLST